MNFVILDDRMHIIAKSKSHIAHLIDGVVLDLHLQTALRDFKKSASFKEHKPYLEIHKGRNYFISRLPNLPFFFDSQY